MKKIKFKEFIKLQRGFDLPKKDMIEGPYPVVGSTSIIGYHKEYKVDPPGVITGRSGSLGKLQYIDAKYWPHNTALWVKDFKGNYPRYVFYFLHTIDFQNFNAGAGVPTLNRNHLDNYDISIHEGLDQIKIASILSNYDDLIENNTKIIRLLEKIAKLIYDEWFVKFKFPGHEKIKFVDSELGKIPEGWEVKKLEESVNNIILGGTPARKNPNYWGGDVPWIKSGKLNDLRIIEGTETITQEGLNKSATKMMPERTVLIAITGAILISLSEIKLCANQSVVGLYGSKNFSQEYLYLYQKKNIDQFISKMSGSAQQHVNKEIIQNSKILVSDIETMGSFNQIIKPIFNEISSLLFKNQTLKKTRDLLIPKLVSGKVDVSDLDIKVPEVKA